MPRPFFRFSIQELERLFEEKNDDPEVFRALHEELMRRRTERAGRLRNRVRRRLVTLQYRPSSGEQKSQVPPRCEPPSAQQTSRFEKLPSDCSQPQLNEAFSASDMVPAEPKITPLNSSPVTNRPEDILSAWMALEVLSPPSYLRPEDLAGGDRMRVSVISESNIPWEQTSKSTPLLSGRSRVAEDGAGH